ncbi:MAG TPA: Na+/H+ antiporter NhaA, partial [Acidimicrobiia bacterium]|nr:Na+/H+ antiporter NhaA [Acidimicrobiia bacterium]
GDLRDPKAAALPVLAALGGMVVPALVYLFFNAGTAAGHGWGIPMATDIAFAVGIVALLGSRVPPGAKLFLLAVAIADDIGAIAVIAIFYTTDLNGFYLAAAVFGLILVWVASKVHVRAMWFYVPTAFLIWYFMLESGVHATLAGVALGFLTPARPYYTPKEFDERARAILDQYDPDDITDLHAQEHADHEALLLSDIASESVSPLNRMEHKLVAWSSFVIVPIFALANAGVDFRDISITEALTSNIALGVAAGLVIGKIVGISLASLGAVRFGLGKLPPGTTWAHVVGLAAVAGIGFTVALFVAGLAFEDPEFADLAKVGIFSGSIVAGIIGSIVLSRIKPRSSL